MPNGDTQQSGGGSAALVLQQEREYADRRTRYAEVMKAFLADADNEAANMQRRLYEFHEAGVACFNAAERTIPWSSLLKADADSDWYTDKGETAANLLGTIAKHFQVIQTKASKAGLSSSVFPPSPSPTAYAAMQRIAKAVVPEEADRLREQFVSLDLPTHGFDHGAKEKPRMPTWQKVTGVCFGITFIAVILAVAIYVPTPTPFQTYVFRTVLALAAGACVTMLSGFFKLEGQVLQWKLRAGAGLAVVLLVYLFNPPALVG